jgi:flavodoxin I
MGDILMIYASQTGNTEQLTDMIAAYIEEIGYGVTIKSFDFDVIDVEALEQYDAIMIGTYTWDDGELPYEVEDFYIDLEKIDLTGKIVSVYGSGDSFYDTFGGAGKLVWQQLKHLGATVIGEPVIIDLEPNQEDADHLRQMVQAVVEAIKKRDETVA